MFEAWKRKVAGIALAIGMVAAPVTAVVATDVAPAGAIDFACKVQWQQDSSIYGWVWTDYRVQNCSSVSVRTLYTNCCYVGAGAWTNIQSYAGIYWWPSPTGWYQTPAVQGVNWYGMEVEAYDYTHSTWQCYRYHVYPYVQDVQNSQCYYY